MWRRDYKRTKTLEQISGVNNDKPFTKVGRASSEVADKFNVRAVRWQITRRAY